MAMTLLMEPRRILFFAPTRIGDAVLSTSILRHLSTSEPDAMVTIVTSPLAAPLFEGYPQLERVIALSKRSYNRHWLDVWRQCIATRWAALWDMRGSAVSYLLRVGKRHSYHPQKEAPKVKQYESAFGIAHLPFPLLWPRTQDVTEAQRLLPEGKRYLVFAPIANWAPKEWPISHYIALASELLEQLGTDYRPVIICAGHEREKARPMLEALARFQPVDLTQGDAALLTIFACMQRSAGFIGNDSGLMHMAAAASIPTLGLYGPTPHDIYQPWGEKAAFLAASEGDLAQLTVAEVKQAFEKLLSSA